jgi:cytochrome c2
MPDVRAFPPSSMLLVALLLAGCDGQDPAASADSGANAERGAALIRAYGCGTCHTIPGVAEARGLVGPPLRFMGRRVYIAGVLPNTPDGMVAWLENPQQIVPGNAMPNLHIGRQDARDLAAYLQQLR